MDPITAAAIISGGGSIISDLLTNKGALKRQKLADKQNIRFWNMQNQYNHPSQQMERLRKAGLNPNLIYGSSVAGATGSAGSIAPSKAAPYNINNPVPAAMNAAQGVSSIHLQNSQGIKNLSDAAYTRSQKNRVDTLLGEELKLYKARAQQTQAAAIIDGLKAKGLQEHEGEYIQSLVDQFLITRSKKDVAKLEAEIANQQGLRPNDPLWYREVKKLKDWLFEFNKLDQFKNWYDEQREDFTRRRNERKLNENRNQYKN